MVMSTSDLPHFNVAMNAAAAVCLVAGYVAIRSGRKQIHKRFMIAAMTFSGLFLIGYLVYHFACPPRRYTGRWPRFYFPMLISHVSLAAVNLPLVIVTATRALRQQFDKHKRIARVTFPIWTYVSVTGVMVYWMLYG